MPPTEHATIDETQRFKTMIALIITCVVALCCGFAFPTGQFLWFLGGTIALFCLQFGLTALTGFNGLPLEEALLLFEGKLSVYLAFAAKTAFRTFAAPIFLFAGLLIWRSRA